MAAIHGSNGFFSVDAHDLSTYIKSGSADQNTETVDVSTLGTTAKKYIQGMDDGQFQLEGVWDDTVDGYIYPLKRAGEKDFVYGPGGNATGKVKYSGKVILVSYNVSNDTGGEVRFSATFQVSGPVTRGTF